MSKRDSYVQFPNGNVIKTPFPEYHPEAKKLSQQEGETLYKQQYKEELLSWIKPNSTIYCVLRSVSSSGMSRRISFFAIKNGELICLDYAIASVMHYKQSDKGGLTISGCGMDMGFHVVYGLGQVLWSNGTPEPHGTRNGVPDSSGGYALRHCWI